MGSLDGQRGSSHFSDDQKNNETEYTDSIPIADAEVQITTGRKVSQYHGVYVEARIEGVNLNFTADTGATRTIISNRIYNLIPENIRPQLTRVSSPLTGAGGNTITEVGKADFTIELGPLSLKREIIVAEIADEGLLGIDILQNEEGGPADILLSKGIIKMQDKIIPCVQIGLPGGIRKVQCEKDCTISGKSETIINVIVSGEETDQKNEVTDMIMEPNQAFSEKYPLILANSLIQVKGDRIVPARIMNPYPNEITLRRHTVVGYAEPLDSDVCCLDREDSSLNKSNLIRQTQEIQEKDIFSETSENIIEKVPHHLKQLFDSATSNKSMEEKRRVATTLVKFQDIFSKDDYDLGCTPLMEHVIDTENAKPVKQPPRRVPIALADEERKAIIDLKEKGVIQESVSAWASPIVLVRKKNGKIRPCVDYRRLNAITRKDAFPLPRTQDCLDAVAGSKLFSTFDLTSGYHQIPVRQKDIQKTAFVTKYGLFEFTKMPFGLTNAPASFERLMEIALQGLQWQTCLIYLDDIIVFGSNFDEHMTRVEEILQRLREANLKLQPGKCHLFQTEVNFLGHIVGVDGVRPNAENVSKILEGPVLKTPTHVRQFLGMANYYRRFVKDFSKLAKPLTRLTCKNTVFQWTTGCQNAFEKLKNILSGPEIMAYPLLHGTFTLDTDASDTAIGAVLSQEQDGNERVIAYASRSLSSAEKNYCVTDKELLAVRYFIEYFRQYLLGVEFKIRTDHQALVWLFSLKEPKERIARWIEILSAYKFSVEYRPGKKHGNADAMSRCPCPQDCSCNEFDSVENLRCGPCKKCKRRAQDMASTWNLPKNDRIARTQLSSEKLSRKPYVWILHIILLFFSFTWLFQHLPTSVVRSVQTRSSSRNQSQQESQTVSENIPDNNQESWCGKYSRSQIQRMQRVDDAISIVHNWFKNGKRPPINNMIAESPILRHYWNQWCILEMKNELIYRRSYHSDGRNFDLQL